MGEDLQEQLAAAVAKWLKLEGQKAVAVKTWGDKIKAVHAEIVALSQAIQDGGGVQGSIEDLVQPTGEPSAELAAEVAAPSGVDPTTLDLVLHREPGDPDIQAAIACAPDLELDELLDNEEVPTETREEILEELRRRGFEKQPEL